MNSVVLYFMVWVSRINVALVKSNQCAGLYVLVRVFVDVRQEWSANMRTVRSNAECETTVGNGSDRSLCVGKWRISVGITDYWLELTGSIRATCRDMTVMIDARRQTTRNVRTAGGPTNKITYIQNIVNVHVRGYLLWPPCVADADIIFLPCGFFLSSIFFFFYSSPNLSGRRLDVYHTSTHAVVLVRI